MAVAEDSDDDIPLFGPDPRLPFPRLPDPASGGDDATAPVVMMVPLTIVSDATFVAPAVMMVAHNFPLTPAPVTLDNDDDIEYDYIDNRAIDVTQDMPSANPSIMNVTSHRQETYADLSC